MWKQGLWAGPALISWLAHRSQLTQSFGRSPRWLGSEFRAHCACATQQKCKMHNSCPRPLLSTNCDYSGTCQKSCWSGKLSFWYIEWNWILPVISMHKWGDRGSSCIIGRHDEVEGISTSMEKHNDFLYAIKASTHNISAGQKWKQCVWKYEKNSSLLSYEHFEISEHFYLETPRLSTSLAPLPSTFLHERHNDLHRSSSN